MGLFARNFAAEFLRKLTVQSFDLFLFRLPFVV